MNSIPPTPKDNTVFLQVSKPFLPQFHRKHNPPGT